ncbi:MAG: hypothetical protein SPF22_08250 [Candidatus Onthovivens sp.]|nr:hypothetical protein [Candidatus Onthovivens sp.]
MGKKERKEALKFILNNEVIVRKLSEAIDVDKKMTIKERRILIKDMITNYRDENCNDSFTVNMFGPGKKKSGIFADRDYRNDDYDEPETLSFTKSEAKSVNQQILENLKLHNK